MISKSIRQCLFHLTVISVQAFGADWLTLYNSGEEKLRLGLAEDASRELLQALRGAESAKVGPDRMAAILDAVGRARFRAGKYREAAWYFERGLQLEERAEARVAVLVNAAQAYRELGEFKKSEKNVREALLFSPVDARVWQMLGSVLFKNRKYEEAEAAERKALALGNRAVAALAWSDLSAMSEARGRYSEAVDDLRRAIGIIPAGHERGRMLVNLGLLEHRAKLENEAVGHLRDAVRELEGVLGAAHPDLAQALDSYAGVLRHVRRKSEAQEAAERARGIRSSLAAAVDWRELKP